MNTGTTLGKYTLVSFLGRGGFGRVYRAIQGGPGGFSRPVAVKVLRAASQRSHAAIDEFAREARTIARLQHRNIVQVYEFTVEDDQYLLVMELIEGVTLQILMRPPYGPLPFWLSLAVAQEVCRGLQHAHTLRDESGRPLAVVHRDVKPSNILVSQQGDVKLTDFGLAKMSTVESDQLTDFGVVKGTPTYMSPEQWRGEPATTASDVFSLSAVLYEMCSGIRFAALSHRGAAGIVRPEPPSTHNKLVPAALNTALLRGLAHNPSERPSCGELLEILQQGLVEVVPSGQLSRVAEELATFVTRARPKLPAVVEQQSVVADSQPPTASAPPPDGSPAFAPRAIAGDTARDSPTSQTLPDRAAEPLRAELPTMVGQQWGQASESLRPAPAPARGRRARKIGFGRTLTLALLAAVWLGTVLTAIWIFFVHDRSAAIRQHADSQPAEDSSAAARRDAARVRRGGALAEPPELDAGPDIRHARQKSHLRPNVQGPPGLLSVNSDPWAKVFLDGKQVGTTPLFQTRVPSGAHQLRLVGANGRIVVRRVVVPPGGHLRLGMISLQGS